MVFDSAPRSRRTDPVEETGTSGRERDPSWFHDLDAVLRGNIVSVLVEAAPGPLVVTEGDEVLTANRAGETLLASLGAGGVRALLTGCPLAHMEPASYFIASPIGALRVKRWPVTAGRSARLHVLVVEPMSIDLDRLYQLAVEAWKPTARQSEVLWAILHGLSNKEIAQRLGTSHRTIEVHVSALLGRAGVDGRSRLLTAARELAAGAQVSAPRTALTDR